MKEKMPSAEVKTGLVLEGGAMRGLFTAGVMDVLMEQNVQFDGALGVSAGAVFGCNYKSSQRGRVLRYNMRFCSDPRYASFSSWLKTGNLYGEEFCYHQIPEIYDPFDTETFASNPMEFYVCATDVCTGMPVYHLCRTGNREDIRWMQASASMPLASRMVNINGQKLLDGGISDSIPLRMAERLHFEKNVVILTQPEGYQKQKNKMLPILKTVYRDYPQLLERIAMRHHDYNETLQYVAAQKRRRKAFVIQPEESLQIGPVEKDPSEIFRVYQLGRKQAEKALPDLISFLES